MEITATTRTARQLAGPGFIIFNDRLADGRRSLKVWRWKLPDYEYCKRVLEGKGHTVELVSFPAFGGRTGTRIQHRLHVTEK